ncbi:MAG: ATP-binding protein [gamma proteobacterium symbiont of Taylorina sp.]|nr:ATP-binding protein [gamma proteobacterium symbiont of Taylorina sp.]
MDIKLVDITLHVDENLSAEQRETLEESLRALDGVISVHTSEKTPHLIIVGYNPDIIDHNGILKRVTDQGAHAKVIAL